MRTVDEDEFSARRAANSLENVLALCTASAGIIKTIDAGATSDVDHADWRRFRPDPGKILQATGLQITDLWGDNFADERHRTCSAIRMASRPTSETEPVSRGLT